MKIRITFGNDEREKILRVVHLIKKNFPHMRMREPEPVDGRNVVYFSEGTR